MKNTTKLTALAVAGILAAATTAAQADDHGQKAAAEKEKCYGVAKAGMNDCHAPGHSCAGSAKTNADPHEWIMMPAGLCDKIVGGSTTPPTVEGESPETETEKEEM